MKYEKPQVKNCRIKRSTRPIACNHARDDAFSLISGVGHPFKEFEDKNGG